MERRSNVRDEEVAGAMVATRIFAGTKGDPRFHVGLAQVAYVALLHRGSTCSRHACRRVASVVAFGRLRYWQPI